MALAKLSIDLEANLAQLQQGLDKAGRLAEKNAEEIRGRYQKAGDALKSFGAGLAAAVSVVAVQQFFSELSAGVLAVKDLAEASGDSIENISGLQDIALKTGTSFDTVTTALIKFNDSLKNAKQDSPVSLALRQIGLEAAELRNLAPSDALIEVSQALSRFADDGNRARLVQELFGRSVKEVAPLLRELADAGKVNATLTAAQVEEYDKFNKSLARAETNALEASRAIGGPLIGAMNELFDVLRGDGPGYINQYLAVPLQTVTVLAANVAFVLKGIGNDIGARAAQVAALARGDFRGGLFVIPKMLADDSKAAREELDALERRLVQLGSAPQADFSNEGRSRTANSTLPSVGEGQAEAAAEAARKAAEQQALAAAAGKKALTDLQATQKAYQSLASSIGQQVLQQAALIEGGDKLSAAQTLRIAVLDKLNNSENTFSQAQRDSLLTALNGLDVLEQQTEALETQARVRAFSASQQEQATNAQLQEVQARIQDNASLRQLAEEYGKTAEAVEALRIARLESVLASEQQQLFTLRNIEGTESEADALQRNIDLLREQIALRQGLSATVANQAESPLAGAQRGIAEYMAEIARAGDATSNAVTNSLRTLEDDITSGLASGKLSFKRFADSALQELLRLQVVRPFLQSLFGGGQGGNTGIIVSALAGFFGGARAEGGPVTGGRAYLVGERGPEMIIPGASGTVIPNKALMGGGGGTSIVLSPNISIDARSDQAQVAQMVASGMAQAQQSMWRQLKARGLA